MTLQNLFDVDPTTLGPARELSHLACQWPSKAARANLDIEEDDSHSNLGWNAIHRALVSHPLDSEQQIQLGFSFATQSLVWLEAGALVSQLELFNNDESTIQAWVDSRLEATGLKPTKSVAMPYALNGSDSYLAFTELQAPTRALGNWYAEAHTALKALIDRFESTAIHRPTIRCWPHHFDLAALFVLEAGDSETARSIGVGLSPGDASYAEPYFYCSPWPAPEAAALPAAPEPLMWHTEGFVALVCRASDLSPDSDLNSVLSTAMSLAEQTR